MKTKTQLPRFESLKFVHIIGVCGTLMGAFAAYLKSRGVRVTGSDQNVYPPMSDVLRNAGVEIFSGYRAENLTLATPRPDLVIIGNVISASNPEARVAMEKGYAYSSLPEALEDLVLRETQNIVVAGTHGKTTTSSLLAHTLVKCRKDPSYFIGGVSLDLPLSFHVSSTKAGSLFVLEGDEYDTAFWDKVPKFNHYLPDHVILTSLEYDHADIYPDFQAVFRAFEGLVQRVRPGGNMIACFDYQSVRDVVKKAQVPVIFYGKSGGAGCQYSVSDVHYSTDRTDFSVFDGGRKVDELMIRTTGMHNVLNTLAVWIECRQIGLSLESIRDALGAFRGVKRRQEIRGEIGGVLVIDDFAHHPTAVRETLRALKARYPERRLIAVFEPRSATSRRKVFQKDYSLAFQEADAAWIATPFDQSRISEEDQFSSEMLVNDLQCSGKDAFLIGDIDDGVSSLSHFSRSGDLIAVLSNGGFGDLIPKLLRSLPPQR